MGNKSGIEWGGRRESETPTAPEEAFAVRLDQQVPGLDYWLHEDTGGPWLLVSMDVPGRGPRAGRTLRLDFDARGIRGGWSPASLNWDDGLRAGRAAINTTPPEGFDVDSPPATLDDLVGLAAAFFRSHGR